MALTTSERAQVYRTLLRPGAPTHESFVRKAIAIARSGRVNWWGVFALLTVGFFFFGLLALAWGLI